jgi:hypothetical protein
MGVAIRMKKLELLAELTFDFLVGDGAPVGSSPMRLALGGRYRVIDPLLVSLVAETQLSQRPDIGLDDPIVPVEPRLSILLGLSYTFDFGTGEPPPPPPPPVEKKPEPPPPPPEPEPPPTTVLSGTVTDAEGNPMGGVQVRLTRGDQVIDTETGPSGEYKLDEAPLGRATLTVGAEDYVESESTIEITPDMPPLQPVVLALEESSEASQLRGLIRAFDGTPVKADIVIMPGNTMLETDASGYFVVDLPPGRYKVKIRAKGYKRQTRTAEIEEKSVTIMNVDLRKRR